MRRAAAFALPALLLAGCAAASPGSRANGRIDDRKPLSAGICEAVHGGCVRAAMTSSRLTAAAISSCRRGSLARQSGRRHHTVLQQPIQNIYLVSSSAMDPIISIGGLGAVALSGTQAENWYLDAARTAMEQGRDRLRGQVQRARLRDDPVRRLRPCHREHNDLPHA